MEMREAEYAWISYQPDVVWRYRRAILIVFGVTLGLLISEFLARVAFPAPRGPFAHNPVIQKQSDQVDLFEQDDELGHRLKDGGFVGVYSSGLVSLKQIAEDLRRKGRLVVLNLGDSSTSGWDSDVIAANAERQRKGEELRSPFQNYKTYSDILAENPQLYVINAGVPGFTSLQGAHYLKRLLAEFKQADVHVDVVTVYFGNNDSAWNGNIEDKYMIPGSGFQLQLLRVVDQNIQRFRLVTRVTASEYGEHIRDIVETCREAGISAILVEPVVPRVWLPGLRAHGLQGEAETHLANLRGAKVGTLLAHARELFAQSMNAQAAGETAKVRQLLEQAREEDYLVPRIKEGHVQVLHEVAAREEVPLVSMKRRIPSDDSAFFLDYCHPVEPANRLIADALMAVIDKLHPGHS